MKYKKNFDLNSITWNINNDTFLKEIEWKRLDSVLPSIHLQKTEYVNWDLTIKANYQKKITYFSYTISLVSIIMLTTYTFNAATISFAYANDLAKILFDNTIVHVALWVSGFMYVVYLLLIPSIIFSRNENLLSVKNKLRINKHIKFDTIYALQFIERKERNKYGIYYIYELSVILLNKKRITIYTHWDGNKVIEEWKIISQYIKKPLFIKNDFWIVSV